jgi:peptidoglycan/LPS O-acetylase OafA/YrhL
VSNSGRIPSLDGFRALSVLIVFAGHARFYSMSLEEMANFLSADVVFFIPARFGVTIFFFISGYIITTLMRSEFERTGSVSFRNFYLRRVYRIFPPLYITLFVAALLTSFGVLKGTVSLPATMAQVFHLTNYYALLVDNDSFLQGTKLLWSLAVEEHFYLVFPLLFLVLSRSMPAAKVGWCLLVICLSVLAWRCYLYYGLNVRWFNWAFIATDCRIDSILYGCLLAVWHNPARDAPLIKQKWLSGTILIAAFGVIFFSIIYKDPAFQRTLMFTLQGVALLPIFACAIRNPDWLIFRWLNWAPIVYIGWISYTFYLCHSMALKIALHYTSNIWVGYVLAFLATVTFSALMYRIVETPLARKRAATHRSELVRQAG